MSKKNLIIPVSLEQEILEFLENSLTGSEHVAEIEAAIKKCQLKNRFYQLHILSRSIRFYEEILFVSNFKDPVEERMYVSEILELKCYIIGLHHFNNLEDLYQFHIRPYFYLEFPKNFNKYRLSLNEKKREALDQLSKELKIFDKKEYCEFQIKTLKAELPFHRKNSELVGDINVTLRKLDLELMNYSKKPDTCVAPH